MTAHTYQTRIYYADTDAGGVAYHAAYLNIAERARTEALRAAGRPHAELQAQHDRVFMVHRINLEYLRPAKLDDLLTVTTRALQQTGATLRLAQDFTLPDGTQSARMQVELVCVSTTHLKPARIPPRWQNLLS